MHEFDARLDSNGGEISRDIIGPDWREPCAVEPLLIMEVVSVVIEPLGVVVERDETDPDETDEVGFTMVFMKRTGTSSVK